MQQLLPAFPLPLPSISVEGVFVVLFVLLALFFLIYSAILLYHWHHYSIGKNYLRGSGILYFLVAFALLGGMGFSILSL